MYHTVSKCVFYTQLLTFLKELKMEQMLIQDSTTIQPPYCSKATYVQYLSSCTASTLELPCLYSRINLKLHRVRHALSSLQVTIVLIGPTVCFYFFKQSEAWQLCGCRIAELELLFMS